MRPADGETDECVHGERGAWGFARRSFGDLARGAEKCEDFTEPFGQSSSNLSETGQHTNAAAVTMMVM